ncbi:hypothetical protein KIH77_08900 [Bifidobacterium sp. 82T24]|nr:hypothetical protein [Bifidobacterium pluvialisilvae]
MGTKLTTAWGEETIGTLPASWRPKADVSAPTAGRDGHNQMRIIVSSNGKINYQNQGGTQSNEGVLTTVCYIAA